MDRLAAGSGMDPVEIRLSNAMSTGTRLPTGQVMDGPAPVREMLEELRAMPLPHRAQQPGGPARAARRRLQPTHGEGIRRGVGFAVGFKNIAFAEGFDDYSTARVRLSLDGDVPLVEIHSAAAEVGQGLVTVMEQIARTELDVERVRVLPADAAVGSAGSSSASRQTWMSGGAVRMACRQVAQRLRERATGTDAPLEILLADEPIDETAVYRHRETQPLDPETGQGDRS